MAWRREIGDDFVSLYGDDIARFWRKVEKLGDDECWPWHGTITVWGYGQFKVGGDEQRLRPAHCFMYELVVGPIPDDLELDHTCHDHRICKLKNECPHRRCVNPRHLEPVPRRTNIERSGCAAGENMRKTECIHGHPLEGDNLIIRSDGGRRCRICKNEASRRAWCRKNGLPEDTPRTERRRDPETGRWLPYDF